MALSRLFLIFMYVSNISFESSRRNFQTWAMSAAFSGIKLVYHLVVLLDANISRFQPGIDGDGERRDAFERYDDARLLLLTLDQLSIQFDPS